MILPLSLFRKKAIACYFLFTLFLLFISNFPNVLCASSKALNKNQAPANKTAALDSLFVHACLNNAKDFRSSQPDSAAIYATQALKRSQNAQYTVGEALALKELGILAKNKGEFKQALAYYGQGLNISQAQNLKSLNAALYNNIGNVYQRLAKLDSALIFFQKSLDIKIELNDQPGIAKAFNNLGTFFAARGDFELSKKYFLDALNMEQLIGSEASISRVHMNLGNVYTYLKDPDSAIVYYKSALDIQTRLGQAPSIARTLTNLGNVHKEKGNYEEALDYYKKSLSIKTKLNNPSFLLTTYFNMGTLYQETGQHLQAVDLLEKGLNLALDQGLIARQRSLHEYLANSYEQLGRYPLALQHHRQYKQLSDSIYQIDQDKIIEEFKIQYETEKQKKELAMQRVDNQKKTAQRDRFILSSSFLLILFLLSGWAYTQKRKDNVQLSRQNQIIEARERDKALLLRELHHRVKNNLQLVSSLLNLQAHQLKDSSAGLAVKEGQSRVEAMALIHRDLYLEENSTQVDLRNYIDNMLSNLLLAFGKDHRHLQVEKQIEDIKLDADIAIPMGLIINELITNALKYAFDGIQQPQLHLVAQAKAGGELFFSIQDNGIGMPAEKTGTETFGMDMVRALAQQLKAQLTFHNEEGTKVEIVVPVFSRRLEAIQS